MGRFAAAATGLFCTSFRQSPPTSDLAVTPLRLVESNQIQAFVPGIRYSRRRTMSVASTGSAPPETCSVSLDQIPTDGGPQARVKVNPAVIREYAEAMKRQLAEGGLCFPPIVLFFDGRINWVGDGAHRIPAARQAGQTHILAEVHPGTQRDALLYSIS